MSWSLALLMLLVAQIGHAQIAQRGSSTSASSTSTSISINKPTGVVSGDVMLVGLAWTNNSSAGYSNPSASGWTVVDGQQLHSNNSNRWYGSVMYKVAGGSEPASYTFTVPNSVGGLGSIVAFSGVNGTGGVNQSGAAGGPFDLDPGTLNITNASTGTAPSITTATNNAAVVMLSLVENDRSFSNWNATNLGGLTEIADFLTTDGQDAAVGMAWATDGTAGSTGSGTTDLSGSSRSGSMLIALRPQTCSGTPAAGTLSAATTSFCTSGSPALTFSPGSSGLGLTYQLQSSSTLNGTYSNVGSAGTSTTFNPGTITTTTFYRVRTVCSNGGASANSNAVEIAVNALPDAGITISGSATVCAPATSKQLNASTTATSPSYQWRRNGVTIAGASGSSYNATASGSYTVVVTSNGCSSSSAPQVINFGTQPAVSAAASSANVCAGNTVDLSATASNTITAFAANTTATAIPDNSTTGISSTVSVSGLPNLGAGVTVRITGLTIPHTWSSDLELYLVRPGGSLSNTANGTDAKTGVAGQSIKLCTDQGGSGDGFNGVTLADAATTAIGGITANTTFTGSYRPETLFSTLTGSPNGTWTLVALDDQADDLGTLTAWTLEIVYPGGISYAWSASPAGFNSTNEDPTGVVVNESTQYTVTATDNDLGCTASASVSVTATAPPNAGTLSGNQGICVGGTSTFTVTGNSATGSYTTSNSAVATVNASGVVTGAGAGTATITYTVSGTGGCGNATATRTITVTAPTTWYADADNDGSGDPATTVSSCAQPQGYVANSNDGCPSDANKTNPGTCGCGTPDTDTDSDGTADCNDGCPNDASKTSPGTCGCGTPDTDTDNDGTADCEDGCPNDPNKTWEGVCGCGNADVDSDGDSVMDCLDACPNDPNKVAPGACGCGIADVDTDGDGTQDCNDQCPGDPNKTSPGSCGCGQAEPGTVCNDNDPFTGNDVVNANCQCAGTPLDCAGVPGGSALPGTPCNDGDPNTTNDVYTSNCGCAGTPAAQNVGLILNTDANGSQTSWEIIPQGGGAALCSGAGYASNTTVTINCMLPDGCYELRVMDSFGDGMTTGGYVLRDAASQRIIDNANDGAFGMVSQVANNGGFCLPLGTDRLEPSRCDLENVPTSDFIAAEVNPAVSAQHGVGNQSDDGYQFWFFNPDGGYSRRVLMAHSTSNPSFPSGPGRCSFLRLNSLTTMPLPQNQLLNVRVRSVVNGVYSAFGPACRLRLSSGNNCSTTQLVNAPNLNQHSWGLTNVLLNGTRTLYAQAVAGAVSYQWEFDDVNSTYLRRISTSSNALLLTIWNTSPLQYGKTYSVRVRVSFNNGASWCPWGSAGPMSTAPVPGQDGGRGMITASNEPAAEFGMWPNPNRGDQLFVRLTHIDATVQVVTIDLFDQYGKRVRTATLPVQDGELQYNAIALQQDLATGLYLVSVTAGDLTFTERLVVQR